VCPKCAQTKCKRGQKTAKDYNGIVKKKASLLFSKKAFSSVAGARFELATFGL